MADVSDAPDDRTTLEAGTTPDDGGHPDASGEADDPIKESFRAALARKSGQNSHVEQHLAGRRVGAGNNDTHKRQFRRKSG